LTQTPPVTYAIDRPYRCRWHSRQVAHCSPAGLILGVCGGCLGAAD